MSDRIAMLETINGEQFKTRYYMNDRMFISLKEDVIIAIKSNHPSIFVFIKSEDGIFDCISDLQIDKESPNLAEIFICANGLINTNVSLGSNVSLQVNIEKSKKLKEKTFFDF